MSGFTYAAKSDCGRVRQQNEDRWFADPRQGLFLVADGMSRTGTGALAAQIVAATLPPLLRRELRGYEDLSTPISTERLRGALCLLSEQMVRQTAGKPGLDGIGSTVVLALVHETRALIGHLGDSRAYLWRKGRLERLTKDHTLLQLLLDSGDVRPEESAQHPARGQLRRFVGMKGAVLPEIGEVDLRHGDRLLLCSDGLSSMVDDQRIGEILNRQRSLEEHCQELVEAANQAGGKDDITVLLIS